MKKSIVHASIATVLLSGTAFAHPSDVPYETRGQCEAAYAESSKIDRERLLASGRVENQGAAQRTFNETFRCEYYEDQGAWFITFLGFPDL